LIAALAGELGVDVWLAGGGVRDCLLGRRVNDLDFALGGACVDLPRLFAERWGGTFFWLDEERLQGRVVRTEAGVTVVHDFAPLRGATIEDDLLLRDFTINALALPVTGCEAGMIDPLHGLADLRGGVIRACSGRAFDDDPLRLLRALRFAAETGFAVEEETWNALRQKTALLGTVAAERVRDELFKILTAPGIGASLQRLEDAGLSREIFPAEFYRPETVVGGRLMAERQIGLAAGVERICGDLERLAPGTAAACADYLGSEIEGGITVESLMKLAACLGASGRVETAPLADRLRLGRKAARLLELFCTDETDLFRTLEQSGTERASYRFFRDREPGGGGMVIIAFASGVIASPLASRLLGYFVRDYDAAGGDLLLSGEEVMAVAGIGEGERVGEVMAALREAESRGLVNDRAEAADFVKNLLTKREPLR
jgi:poly(A) polymerase